MVVLYHLRLMSRSKPQVPVLVRTAYLERGLSEQLQMLYSLLAATLKIESIQFFPKEPFLLVRR